MAETATEEGVKTETIDQAIEKVETLYRSVTGREAPPIGEKPYAGIPAERAPERHVEEQIDRLIETLGRLSGPGIVARSWTPPMSVWDSEQEIVLRLDLPGTPRHEAKVTATRGLLEVFGRRPHRSEEDGEQKQRLRYAEPPYGEFRRVIPLPPEAEVDRLQARMKDGVLEIRVPRNAKSAETRSVSVG